MAVQRFPLDTSLQNRIESPSAIFQDFLNQYFLTPQYYLRGDHDTALLDHLGGEERKVAADMILANLPSGQAHLIDALVQIDDRRAVPVLQSMQTGEYDSYERYIIARALHSFHAMATSELFSLCDESLRCCAAFTAWAILDDSYCIFSPSDARPLIDIGLRRRDYDTRASAYRAAVALLYIEEHGQYSDDIARVLWEKEAAAAQVGSPRPTFYEQLQYYVGDTVYANAMLFERRLTELWDKDARARQTPLYTEQ